MSVEIGLLIALTGCIIGIVTLIVKVLSQKKKDGEEWGEFKGKVEGDLAHIKTDVAEIKQMSLASAAEVKVSISRVYDRMDAQFREEDEKIRNAVAEHEQRFHHGG